MDIYEIRRRNLWHLVHPFGYSDQGVKQFADNTGKSEQRIRHLIAKSPDDKTAKTIGSNAAREFERLCNLENGWLDHKHPENWGLEYFRLSRLQELVELYGSRSKLADQLNVEYLQINMIFDKLFPFDDRTARDFEERLSLPDLWFDIDEQHQYRNVAEPDKDYITIPQYDVMAAMGPGQVSPDYIDTVKQISVRQEYFSGRGISFTDAKNLAIIIGYGQSMEGTINDGDLIIVDQGINSFVGDGVYVFTWDNLLYTKRLQKKSPTQYNMISDNTSHENTLINIDDTIIHAKVLMVWNAKKL